MASLCEFYLDIEEEDEVLPLPNEGHNFNDILLDFFVGDRGPPSFSF